MPTLTNKLDLPAPIAEAVRGEDYDPGRSDYTVTQLIDPPRKVVLVNRHSDEIEEDVSNLIYALFGRLIHKLLDHFDDDAMSEERLYIELDGHTIGGKPDRLVLEDSKLVDYKVCSVWEHIYGLKPEREQQLNCYAALARENGYEVESLEIVQIFRDWSKSKAAHKADYPSEQVARVPVHTWPHDRALEWMRERLTGIVIAEKSLPECTHDERWAKDDTWAVMKKGRKSALRVLDTEDEAWQWIADNVPEKHIEKVSVSHRPGESVRCKSYCSAADFCSQWERIKAGENN